MLPGDAPRTLKTKSKSSSRADSWRECGPWLGGVDHNIDVDVAVTRVSKTSNREAMLRLKPRGEAEQIF